MAEFSEAETDYGEGLLDDDALRAYLKEEVGPGGDFFLERRQEETSGASNETFFVEWGHRKLVLRRPPPGESVEVDYDPLHDVLREYEVMSALQETEVPVPRPVSVCEDSSVIGAPFYLMERLEGEPISQDEPERFAKPEYRARISREYVDGLTAIHGVDYEEVGLEGIGEPGTYTREMVKRCRRQWERATSVTAQAREVSLMEGIGEWLHDRCPNEHPKTLVHGDYKMDNLMLSAEIPPQLVAILDWEMSSLGDPLVDLGWFLSYWSQPKDPEYEVPPPDFLGEEGFMETDGYFSRRELVDRYEQQTGYEYTDDCFYRTLGVYKLGVILEGFYARYLQDQTDHPLFEIFEEFVPYLAAHARAIVEGKEPL